MKTNARPRTAREAVFVAIGLLLVTGIMCPGIVRADLKRAQDATYLFLPGMSGPASAPHSGWFEVSQDTVTLLPGLYDEAKKAVSTRCSATVRTQLGAAGATLSSMVGGSLGGVRLERVVEGTSPTPGAVSDGVGSVTLYRANLRNAVLLQEMTVFDAGGAFDILSLRFDGIDVTTSTRKPDGSQGSGVQSSFNCLLAP